MTLPFPPASATDPEERILELVKHFTILTAVPDIGSYPASSPTERGIVSSGMHRADRVGGRRRAGIFSARGTVVPRLGDNGTSAEILPEKNRIIGIRRSR
ncbi:MAG: hypothetical protein LUO93_06110 [Methanomicrobiales archaeon]|nr:hypothetical protein [Methanomicrobiales archaeon]